MSQDRFKWEVDPEAVEASLRTLQRRARELFDQGRYTRVRLRYKGKQLGGDFPLGALLAMEGVGLLIASPLYVLVANLGVKAFIEVEFIHEAEDRIKEGLEAFNAGEVDAAEAKYREALGMRPDDPAALYALGVLLRVTGRRDEAMACLEKVAATENPDRAKAAEALEKMKRGLRTL